jgi:hypothetical protein
MNKKKSAHPKLPGGGFSEANWNRWTNAQRLAWMTNFRDTLRDERTQQLDVTEKDIEQLDRDIVAMKRVVEHEKAAAAVLAASARRSMEFHADEILGMLDQKNARSIYVPPKMYKGN